MLKKLNELVEEFDDRVQTGFLLGMGVTLLIFLVTAYAK